MNNKGLTKAEVEERISQGQVNILDQGISKSKKEIVLSHTITYFNILNLFLAVLILVSGQIKNMTFLLIVVSNSVIGIFQELKVKSLIDQLSVLTAVKARVVREGIRQELPVDEVVMDDLLAVEAGDQICTDCIVEEAYGLEINESMLTGESKPVKKRPGDMLMSGSFVAAGSGYGKVIHVGEENYAVQLAAKAKTKKRAASEMKRTIERIIRIVSVLIVPAGIALYLSHRSISGMSFSDSLVKTVGGVIGMIPEGLVLLTSVSFILGVGRLARKRALVQEMEAIEALARVDVLCTDKTGTITTGELEVKEVAALDGHTTAEVHDVMNHMAFAFEDVNITQSALMSYFRKTEGWIKTADIPFSSERKYRAIQYEEQGIFVLGAPEFLLNGGEEEETEVRAAAAAITDKSAPAQKEEAMSGQRISLEGPVDGEVEVETGEDGSQIIEVAGGHREIEEKAPGHPAADTAGREKTDKTEALLERIRGYSEEGLRVLLLGKAKSMDTETSTVAGIEPIGLIIISDVIRPTAEPTFAYFREQGVSVKVVSGDNPLTVSRIAQKAGLDGADRYIDASSLPADPEELKGIIDEYNVFGRVTPEHKQALVKAFQLNKHTVGMIGDGVNDVLAIKDADCGIAMAAGSDSAKQAAHIVLMDSDFASMPAVVTEGRIIIANIERVSALYLTKTIYSVLLCVIFIILERSYPFIPVQLSLISTLMIGIPSFLLTLEQNQSVSKGGFLPHVMRNALPAALSMVCSILIIQHFGNLLGLNPILISTMNTVVGGAVSLWVLYRVCLPMNWRHALLTIAMGVLFLAAMLVFPEFLSVDSPLDTDWILMGMIVWTAMGLIFLFSQIVVKCYQARNKIGEKREAFREKRRQKKKKK